jgi:hypothetical protein
MGNLETLMLEKYLVLEKKLTLEKHHPPDSRLMREEKTVPEVKKM